jgi:hypothetical protein
VVSIHVDVVDSEDELAELFLSTARYEQALQEVSTQGGGKLDTTQNDSEINRNLKYKYIFFSDGRQHTTIESIARWMVKDVRKEAKAEFEAAARPLRWFDILQILLTHQCSNAYCFF